MSMRYRGARRDNQSILPRRREEVRSVEAALRQVRPVDRPDISREGACMTAIRVLAVVIGMVPAIAHADDDVRQFPDPTGPAYTIKSQGERSTNNKLALASIAGGGLLLGAVGLYFHLDSRDAADSVSALIPTSHTWSAADQEAYDRAGSSGTKAKAFYALGSIAVLTAIVGYIITDPPTETTLIRPHRAPKPVVAPEPGGAIVGGAWSF
jgi:hypothetical protein